jgi:hypothetical protein
LRVLKSLWRIHDARSVETWPGFGVVGVRTSGTAVQNVSAEVGRGIRRYAHY